MLSGSRMTTVSSHSQRTSFIYGSATVYPDPALFSVKDI
jgi:hypothetical protein